MPKYVCVRKCYHDGKIFLKGRTYELTAKSRGKCDHLRPITPARTETMPELEDELPVSPEQTLIKEAEAEDLKKKAAKGKKKPTKPEDAKKDEAEKPDRFLE